MTGVEDLLQEDVARCIEEFRLAGIKVWMLTGDKGETALEIGLLCGMYDNESVTMLEVQDGLTEQQLGGLLKRYRQMIAEGVDEGLKFT